MEFLLYLLMTHLPVLFIVFGIVLLITGLMLRKTQNKLSKIFLLIGACCVGIFLGAVITFFLIGALEIGPVPS